MSVVTGCVRHMMDEHCYVSIISLLLLDHKHHLNRSLHPLRVSGLDDLTLPECIIMGEFTRCMQRSVFF